uniref:Uncharacterized protein n=1 Tax=Parascaris univalens TaxID=6257 RepID=A0A915CBQ0_PARUN
MQRAIRESGAFTGSTAPTTPFAENSDRMNIPVSGATDIGYRAVPELFALLNDGTGSSATLRDMNERCKAEALIEEQPFGGVKCDK